MPIGLTMPFAQTTSSLGFLAFTTTEIDATLQNLKSLVLTNWGERPNHYYLGCNLIEFLFAQVGPETEDQVVQRIQEQVSQWLPYVVLDNVSVELGGSDGHQLSARIEFHLRDRQDMSSVLEVAVGG